MKPLTLRDYKRRLLKVLVHIQQHLDDELTTEELAALACVSPRHFHRIFSGMLGESLAAHLRRLRLERAAVHLTLTRRRILDLALAAGFDSHEAFTRAFTQAFQLSPSEYRRRHAPTYVAGGGRHRVHFTSDPLRDFAVRPLSPRTMNVKIVSLPPQRAAFVRHVGPYQEVCVAWDRLTTELGRQGFIGPGARFFGLCHDDPAVTEPARLRYDACVTVPPDFQPDGDIGVQTIAGGDYAVLTHLGPYEQLGRSYAALLGEWLPRSGRELRSAPCFEEYLNTPESTAPEDLVTDIHAPLA